MNKDSILESLGTFKLEIELIEGIYASISKDDWKAIFQDDNGRLLRGKLRECCGMISGELMEMRLFLLKLFSLKQQTPPMIHGLIE